MKQGLLLLLVLLAASGKAATNTLSNRRITSKYGKRTNPVTGKEETHHGIDLELAANTPLYAPADAIITKVWYNAVGGNQLIYRLKNGISIGYAHLNKVSVKVGQQVKKGALLGLSGSTGQVTAAHLHVSMRDKAGNWMDPTPYFSTK